VSTKVKFDHNGGRVDEVLPNGVYLRRVDVCNITCDQPSVTRKKFYLCAKTHPIKKMYNIEMVEGN
jgi:hypothetical protein